MSDDYEQILQIFQEQLQQHLASTVEMSKVKHHFTILSSPALPFQIYVYGFTVSKRIVNENEKTIHIDLDILKERYEIVLNRIVAIALNQKKAYARQTVVARVDKKNTLQFLSENHLQGAMPGKYRYGLFLAGELISLAVFSGGRKMPELHREDYRSFELIRFCNKIGYNVVGGISKLLKAFSNDFSPGDIMTYTDKDWSQESSLEKIGFIKKSEIGPLQFWVQGSNRNLIRNEDQLTELKKEFPKGYLIENSGSLKLIKQTK